ncbi:MAG TPA: hypothetical protein VK689_07070, partial [Armatimonadota bacterium]|nr:hypothetical protein [Armatimonadota bacterium]
ETVQRGQELYERAIRPQVEAGHRGSFVLIDIETGECQVSDDYHSTAQEMIARKPSVALCTLRIGYPAVGRIGWRASA